jgi:hypothetical protein
MSTQFHSAQGHQALVISRSTGAFITHHLRGGDHELANEWARCLAQSRRVELWYRAQLVSSFPPMLDQTAGPLDL